MIRKTVFSVIRQLTGTKNVFDGIKRLAEAGLGERAILPGILLDTATTPGKRRTEQDITSVIDTMSHKGFPNSGKLYPTSSGEYYRRVSDYQQTERYSRPGPEDSEIVERPGSKDFSPSMPFRPTSAAPAQSPSRPLGPIPSLPRSTIRGGVSAPRPRFVSGFGSGEDSPGDGWSAIQEVNSSHIYSIAYNEKSKQCAVTFRLPSSGLTVRGTEPSLCSGEYQKWIKRKPTPSVTYVYGNQIKPFPLSLYKKFSEAPSKGRFLWENIRGCGEHIFPFTTFDIDIDGAVFLPTYDGGINKRGMISNEPTEPPTR